jgi:AAA15 family ATPase/GTPase
MNKLASLLVISFILSCSQKMNLSGNYSRDFSRVEKKQLYTQVSTHGNFSVKTKVIIEGVVVSNVKKIGLYTYKIYNEKSVGVKNKLLKFKSKIVFTSKDDESNKIIINQFQKEYSKYFTPEQMEKIKESFLKGPEMIGRFL